MYNVKQFTKLIEDTLETLQKLTGKPMASQEAVDLLLLTAAHESHLGTYLWQDGGPARGAFMMEPATEDDIGDYMYRKQWYNAMNRNYPYCGNSIALARIHYWRVSDPLPKRPKVINEDSMDYYYMELANYAKKHYNTELGKATPLKYYEDFKRCVLNRS